MGQYYRVYTKDDGIERVFDRSMRSGGYVGAKLLEHSWWENPFMMAFSKFVYDSGPMQIAWVGDYADEFDRYERVWGFKESEPVVEEPMQEVGFTLDGRYLVNESRHEYLDCDAYKWRSLGADGWVIHPLSLLTCIGNGRGGGDYRAAYVGDDSPSSIEFVGSWCGDVVGITDKRPVGCTEVSPTFIERGRERDES